MNPTTPWPELGTQLQHDQQTTQQLLQLLEDERIALESRNYDTLNALLAQKQPLLSQLEGNAKQRSLWLKHYGFKDERQLLKSAEQQAPDVADIWNALADDWELCQERNRVNDMVAKRTKLVADRLLDLLHGTTQKAATYGADGAYRSKGLGRSITSA